MKFMIFLLSFLTIFLGVNIYVPARISYYLHFYSSHTKLIYLFFLGAAFLSIAGFLLEQKFSSTYTQWGYVIGSVWLGFLLYIFITLFFIDCFKFLFSIFGSDYSMALRTRYYAAGVILIAITLLLIGGFINARRPVIVNKKITIEKPLRNVQNLRVVVASDLHFGAIIGKSYEKKFTEMVSQLQPDIVFLCGDIIDGNVTPVIRKGIGSHIKNLQPPLGVFAVTGNHEYIGDILKSKEFYQSINIPIIKDCLVVLDNGLQIIGRKDAHSFTQLPLDSLMEKANLEYPIVVLNHQPHHLQQAADLGVDLHLSGHTHHGQLWPFNYITQALFDISWGYKKINNSHFYVSSGFGTWGPPFRIGNKPEVLCMDIHFSKKIKE